MKLRSASFSLMVVFYFTLAVAPVFAASLQLIYSNGPLNGYKNAWNVNFGYEVSDSFAVGGQLCPAGCDLSEITVGLWAMNGDMPTSAEVAVGTSPFGSDLSDSTAPAFDAFQFNNHFSGVCCDIYLTTIFLDSVSLTPDTYWLTLENVASTLGGPVYWDENDGQGCTGTGGGKSCITVGMSNAPGTGCIFGSGCPPSHSEDPDFFGTRLGGTTPEPSSILLFGSGVLGIAGLLRRKANL